MHLTHTHTQTHARISFAHTHTNSFMQISLSHTHTLMHTPHTHTNSCIHLSPPHTQTQERCMVVYGMLYCGVWCMVYGGVWCMEVCGVWWCMVYCLHHLSWCIVWYRVTRYTPPYTTLCHTIHHSLSHHTPLSITPYTTLYHTIHHSLSHAAINSLAPVNQGRDSRVTRYTPR